MRIKKYIKNFTFLAIILFHSSGFAGAQNLPAPREEKLLNGMKLVVWQDAQAPKTSVKLRIHSGSAFDPLNKEGVMALLADILFPNQSSQEYFAEDLGGSLEVVSSYDYIQINATGDHDKILEMLEAIAQAITITQIDKETTAKVRAARLEKLKELEKNPSYVADLAVAKQLFGSYPYGRPQMGSTETVSKIDFADVLLAKQKFLTSDNATLAVSGNVRADLIFRAARRYFGGWTKADKKVPATFTQPGAPDTKLFLINAENESANEVRFAMRVSARNDKNFIPSKILVRILENRLNKENAQAGKNNSVVLLKSHLLSSFIVVALSNYVVDVEAQLSEKPPQTHRFSIKDENIIPLLLMENVSADEFQKAKAEVSTEMGQKTAADLWLDMDTYKLAPIKDEIQKFNEVTVADVQQAAANLQKQPAVKIWLVKQPATVKSTN